jgi:hypothetical protein
MPQTDLEERRIFNTLTIFALLIRCPAGEAGNVGNCPFAEFRNGYGLEEKFMIAESIPDDKCREMLGYHDNCLVGVCRDPRQVKMAA